MTVAVLLGLAALQGVTEFLPVSSSGHLALAQHLLGFGTPPVLFDVSLHLGTLLAVVWLYRREAWGVCVAGWQWLVRPLRRDGRWRSLAPADDREAEALGIVVATFVTGAVGLPFAHRVEQAAGSMTALGMLFVAAGVLLAATRWARPGTRGVTPALAGVIGVAQAVAILPGISRSGLTIAAALFLGVEREAAARFSFLLAVPAILGAEVVGSLGELGDAGIVPWQHVAGALVAGLVGVLALATLVRLVRRGALHWFALYLIPLGVAVAAFVR
jgi:undecaprenyl-diphosphatase